VRSDESAPQSSIIIEGGRPSGRPTDFPPARPAPSRMSDEYRIAKLRSPVEVTLANGSRLDGDVFVQSAARFHPGPEEPIDLLNDPDPFLPLAAPTGEVRLLQKAQIAVVGMPLPATEEPVAANVVGMRVEFTLIDGSQHVGSVFPELPADRTRLVDFLNETSLQFLALFTTEQLRLVNRVHIAYVRPVS
jgi:hypothetical protein